ALDIQIRLKPNMHIQALEVFGIGFLFRLKKTKKYTDVQQSDVYSNCQPVLASQEITSTPNSKDTICSQESTSTSNCDSFRSGKNFSLDSFAQFPDSTNSVRFSKYMSQSHTTKSVMLNDTHMVKQDSVIPAKDILELLKYKEVLICVFARHAVFDYNKGAFSNLKVISEALDKSAQMKKVA
nr:hypothetical protein [Tanacetum cinerariifolium]